jgi:hypothetical protein
MKRTPWHFLKWWIACCAVLGLGSGASTAVEPREIALHPITVDPAPLRPTDLDEDGENLYILDSEGHRLLVMRGGKIVRSIGGIGNAPGELYYPSTMAVTSDGLLVLRDNGNHRFQILDRKGRYVRELPLWKSWGMAFVSDRIYIGRPESGGLIEALGASGRKLAPIGELLSPTALVGELAREYENVYRNALNRVRLTADHEGNIWAAFQHAPRLRKYSAAGDLLLEVEIELPGIEILEKSVREPDTRPPWASSINIDGIQLTVVSRDIQYDRQSKSVMVLLGDNRVVGFTSEGRLQYVAIFPNVNYTLTAVSSTPDGAALVVSSFGSPILVGEHPAVHE